MIVYAESSAVLSWLLDENLGPAARQVLEEAEGIVTSDLTLVEVDRAFHRARRLGALDEAKLERSVELLHLAARHWTLLRLNEAVVSRARANFPDDAIRTLDALHLATVLVARSKVPQLGLLSLDERVRRCGRALGLPILPDSL